MMRLTKEREAKGWTRTKLGAECNIHPAAVGQFENRRLVPYPVQLERLAKALNFEGAPEDLLAETES